MVIPLPFGSAKPARPTIARLPASISISSIARGTPSFRTSRMLALPGSAGSFAQPIAGISMEVSARSRPSSISKSLSALPVTSMILPPRLPFMSRPVVDAMRVASPSALGALARNTSLSCRRSSVTTKSTGAPNRIAVPDSSVPLSENRPTSSASDALPTIGSLENCPC